MRVSQAAFAERFCLSVGMIRDVEQGRVRPSRAFRVLLELIDEDPGRAAAALARAGYGDPDISRTAIKREI